jgi:hypothetical protein
MTKEIFCLRILVASALLFTEPSETHAGQDLGQDIEASAQIVLGDNDSKLDGRRLALREAQRIAIEKAGTYIESLSEVKNFQLTTDQVRTYAGGILEVKEVGEKWDKIGDNLAVTLKVKVRIDKSLITERLEALKRKTIATQELNAANARIKE